MKQPSKFQRWFLNLFGGVPKSDYDIVVEQRDNFVGDLKINDLQIKKLKQENELLKKQIAHLKEIKKVVLIGSLPIEQTERCLRDAVLMEAAPFIKIEHKPSDLTATATLLVTEVEDD